MTHSASKSPPRSEGSSFRSAVTLIEMVVVIGITAIVGGLAVTSIVWLMTSVSSASDAATNAASTVRLSRQFRDDVHAAESATVVDDRLVLQTKGRDITYASEGPTLMRRVDGRPPETFRSGAAVTFAVTPSLVVLRSLGQRTDGTTSGRETWRFEAARSRVSAPGRAE